MPMIRFLLFACVVSTTGCFLAFDGDGDGDGDDRCALRDLAAPAPLRDPSTLGCATYGDSCDPACGPCPAIFEEVPTWGLCDSGCEALGETDCAEQSGCRVVKDARCSISADCLTDYVGCFALDQVESSSVDCLNATADDCSRSAECWALHEATGARLSPAQQRPFALCIRADGSPGSCTGEVACRADPPACPAGTIPGVSGTCWSGACIPEHLCI